MKKSKTVENFHKKMKNLGFRKVPLFEKKKDFKRLGKVFPSRVTGAHHYQDMYVFEHQGYRAVINSGIIDGKLLKPGLSWALITLDHKRLFVRAFKSNTANVTEAMADRLIAYAYLLKGVLLNRPTDTRSGQLKDLREQEESFLVPEQGYKRILKNYWMSDNDPAQELFEKELFESYLQKVPARYCEIINNKEKSLTNYYRKRPFNRFRKEVRKKSKTEKSGNSFVK